MRELPEDLGRAFLVFDQHAHSLRVELLLRRDSEPFAHFVERERQELLVAREVQPLRYSASASPGDAPGAAFETCAIVPLF